MRTIEVKVFTSDHKGFERFRFTPLTKGIEYSPLGVKQVISEMVVHLKSQFPGNEFRIVELNDHSFNVLPVQGYWSCEHPGHCACGCGHIADKCEYCTLIPNA